MTKFAIALPLLLAAVAEASDSWYPQWDEGTCKDNDVDPTTNTWLLREGSGYLYPDLNSCCERYYTGDGINKCIDGGGGTVVGTNKYYPAWDQSPHTCARDCAEESGDLSCGGVLGPGVGTTYATAELCCAQHLSSLTAEYCLALTNGQPYAGTHEWYLDSSLHICVKDCETGTSCGGVVQQSWQTLFPTVAECCAAKLASVPSATCESQSSPGNYTAVATNMWHAQVDVCKKDCTGTGPECKAASAYDTLYDTASECCAGGLSWVKEDYCETRSDPSTHGVSSTPFSHKWFVDYQDSVCKQDCDDTSGGPACDSGVTASTEVFDTAAACCAEKVSWMDATSCETGSVAGSAAAAVGNDEWYGDYSATPARCVQNCATDANSTNTACTGVVENTAGVSFFADAEKCCASKFTWYDPLLCKVHSMSPAQPFTGKWYVKYPDKCVQDCPSGHPASPGCNGSPADLGEELFDDAEKCCATKLSWIDADVCEGTASGAGDLATDQWLVDYGESKCVKDCAVNATDPACDGIVENKAGLQLFDTSELCCSNKLSYIKKDLCAARSDGGDGHSNKFYPDQGKGICKQDCPTSDGGSCAGVPSDLSIPIYDTAKACCAGSVGWVDSDSCQQISSSGSAAGTDKWLVDYGAQKCVKDCAVNATDVGCDGIVENQAGVQLFATSELCCSNKLSYINEALCLARSDGGAMGDGHSAKFYPDQGEGVCKQDCPVADGMWCGGSPSDLSIPIYDSPDACCSGSIGWADSNTCAQTALLTGGSAGTDKWYIDWASSQCVQDCEEDVATPTCGGLKEAYMQTYDTPNSCCAQSAVAWKPYAECVKS